MTIENNAMACCRFVQLVRDFTLRLKPYQPQIRYFVKPDEIRDATKISQRVYGRREEYLVVLACAGLSTLDEPITGQWLILPTEAQLKGLKRRAGFENNHEKRRLMPSNKAVKQ